MKVSLSNYFEACGDGHIISDGQFKGWMYIARHRFLVASDDAGVMSWDDAMEAGTELPEVQHLLAMSEHYSRLGINAFGNYSTSWSADAVDDKHASAVRFSDACLEWTLPTNMASSLTNPKTSRLSVRYIIRL